MSGKPAFEHRSYYVNFASHLLNGWNANMMHQGAGHRWGPEDFAALFDMIKAFGFTCFEYWLEPTVYKTALCQDGVYTDFVVTMRRAIDLAHERGLKIKFICSANCVGHEWYFACPKLPEDRVMIEKLWRHWNRVLSGTDIVGIFPGDPGGCNRHGCDHNTFIDLALDLTAITQTENPSATVEIGTWGTPFSGWGEDMHLVPGWDGTWKMLLQGVQDATQGIGCHIWNGTADRARRAMADFIRRLPQFPHQTLVGINLGFSPDADCTYGGDARTYIREIARTHRVCSWDYSVVEGELVAYPHWRLPRTFARRREERAIAPYFGAMSYTMTPRLSHLGMYAAAQAAIDPTGDPDATARAFCRRVFGSEHEALGELMEVFEVVPGWGHYPRRKWSREEANRAYLQIIDHLEAADVGSCDLPLIPSPEVYRQDLLWFARQFAALSGKNPDREAIRKSYWQKSLSIYDAVPMSADERAEAAAKAFSKIWE